MVERKGLEMSQTIITYYLSPTNHRGSRIKAVTASGISVVLPWDHSCDIDTNHFMAFSSLCSKMRWFGSFVCGALKNGEMVWVNESGYHYQVGTGERG